MAHGSVNDGEAEASDAGLPLPAKKYADATPIEQTPVPAVRPARRSVPDEGPRDRERGQGQQRGVRRAGAVAHLFARQHRKVPGRRGTSIRRRGVSIGF